MKNLQKRRKTPLLETDPYDDPIDQMWDFIVRDTSSARPWVKNMGYAALALVLLYIVFGVIAGLSSACKINTKTYCNVSKDLPQNEFSIDNYGQQQFVVKWDTNILDMASETPISPPSGQNPESVGVGP